MTAVERLEAAIAKLERAKDFTTSGPWEHVRDSEAAFGYKPVWESLVLSGGGEAILDWGSDVREADAELIVTLHRTIDAQLAVLRAGLSYGAPLHTELALADAILGDNS